MFLGGGLCFKNREKIIEKDTYGLEIPNTKPDYIGQIRTPDDKLYSVRMWMKHKTTNNEEYFAFELKEEK
jgi:hypothetical protein